MRSNKRIPDGHRFTATMTPCVSEKNKGLVMALFHTDGIATDTGEKPMTMDEVLIALKKYAKKRTGKV